MKKIFKQCSGLILLTFISSNLFGQSKKLVDKSQSRIVSIYTTADSTNLRLTKTDSALVFKELRQPNEGQILVFVDTKKTYQTMLGIGAAITDASAETLSKLSPKNQQALLEAYYSPTKGIGYILARTNINSCDFSSDMYTYTDANDVALKTFDVAHDRKYKIPFIKKAIALTNNKLTLFASPWSPPSWMKDNNDMLHGGKLKKENYQPWANYFVKFINAYKQEGINIWGVSIQNEPMATQRWESCIYTAEEERDFLKNNLGPTFEKAGLANKKIIVWDHNRDLMYQRADVIFNDATAAKYAWGMGFHWYENWSGGTPMFENVKRVQEAFPTKNLLFTEGCAESFNAEKYNNWVMGERYAKSIINDFNNGTVGWCDWNILLDETGGPNHVGNFCFAPVHGDTKKDEIIFTNAYYYIGHFSKFIQPGAKRISAVASRSQLLTTAFANTDGSIAVVVMNQSDKPTTYNLCMGFNAVETTILPHAIQTLVVK
jgi:glucosylceramidase